MNPNRPRKEKPAWIAEQRPNKAGRPKHHARPKPVDEVAELKRVVSDLSISSYKREAAARKLAVFMKKS